MLEHSGEATLVIVAAWRFLLSSSYRRKKLNDWRVMRHSLSGKLVIVDEIVGEIVAATMIGMVLPLWLIALFVVGW